MNAVFIKDREPNDLEWIMMMKRFGERCIKHHEACMSLLNSNALQMTLINVEELTRLRAEVEKLHDSERGLLVMNEGLAKWKDDLQKKVEMLKRPCSCRTHFMMNRKLEEKNHELRFEVEELKRNQLKPGEVRAMWWTELGSGKRVLVEVKE